MQPDEVDREVDGAAKAFVETDCANLTPNDRGVILHRLADEVEKRKAVIVQIEALDCGKIASQAESDVQNFIDTFRYFADLALNGAAPDDTAGAGSRGLDRAPAIHPQPFFPARHPKIILTRHVIRHPLNR